MGKRRIVAPLIPLEAGKSISVRSSAGVDGRRLNLACAMVLTITRKTIKYSKNTSSFLDGSIVGS